MLEFKSWCCAIAWTEIEIKNKMNIVLVKVDKMNFSA